MEKGKSEHKMRDKANDNMSKYMVRDKGGNDMNVKTYILSQAMKKQKFKI